MPLEDHLLKNEKVLSSAKSVSKGFLLATNQRVIKYDKDSLNEKVESLSYSHLVAATYEKKSYLGLSVIGAIFFGLGFWAALYVSARSLFLSLAPPSISLLYYLLIIWGVIFVALGLAMKSEFYQIEAVSLSDWERRYWRTKGADKEAKTFARFIQDQVSAQEMQVAQPPHQPPTATENVIINSDIHGMNYCPYCGNKTVENAIYCAKCGRKL